jgi:hypothetical protein
MKILIYVCVFFASGCASTIQSTSITSAYKTFEANNYKRTLELIYRAEHAHVNTPELEAELTYLKALTHEMLGNNNEAVALYRYLLEQHTNSQYGYLSRRKLIVKF